MPQRQRDEVKALNEKLERTLYAAHVNLAKNAWDEGSVGRARELLDQHRPRSGSDLAGFEWHYLQRLCHLDLCTLCGHTAVVWCVAFSPDGRWLASAGAEAEG